jgi:hypothetical protein
VVEVVEAVAQCGDEIVAFELMDLILGSLKDLKDLIVVMPTRNFLDEEGGAHIERLDEQVDVLHNRGSFGCLLLGAECCLGNLGAQGGGALLREVGFGPVIELDEPRCVNEFWPSSAAAFPCRVGPPPTRMQDSPSRGSGECGGA